MRKYWLLISWLWVNTAQAQFVRNSGLTIINSANVMVNGDWDNQSGAITNNGTFTLSDNWTSTAGYSQASTGGFILTNNITRQFNHSRQSIGFLTKNGSGITQVNDHLIVKDNLTLINGLLSMTGLNDTLILQAQAHASATTSSFIVGKVTRYGTGDLFFPVSRASNYLPLTVYQVEGANPRVTVSVEDKPGGYSADASLSGLTSFPYVWRSGVLRADTAGVIEVQYPIALVTPDATVVARSVAGNKYASLGAQNLSTNSGVTTIKSYVRGLNGLFSVAVGVILSPPIATIASGISANAFTANWNAVPGAISYQLDVSSDNFATYVAGYNSKTATNTSEPVTGLTAATAYQYRVRAMNAFGNSIYSNTIDVTTPPAPKQDQVITFGTISAKTIGDAPFNPGATASSALTITYTTITPAKLTISGNQLTLIAPGLATIIASQSGDASFNAAPDVSQTFCINPAKPVITTNVANAETLTLSSNAAIGNQWFKDGIALTSATNATLTVATEGVYQVQVKADDCMSELSTAFPVIVTGDITSESTEWVVSPNPVEDMLVVRGIERELNGYRLFDLAGRSASITLVKRKTEYIANVGHLSQGMYVLRLSTGNKIGQVKFVKK